MKRKETDSARMFVILGANIFVSWQNRLFRQSFEPQKGKLPE